ncbi:MAG: PadR family transcriptional regulator [Candidatus Bathyarchaeia archaeon]
MAFLWSWHKCRDELGISPVELMELILIGRGSRYGYEITQELSDWFHDFWVPNFGTIYHALRRLEKRGLVRSFVERRKEGLDRKRYVVTKRGEAALEKGVEYFRKQIEVIRRFTRLVNGLATKKAER